MGADLEGSSPTSVGARPARGPSSTMMHSSSHPRPSLIPGVPGPRRLGEPLGGGNLKPPLLQDQLALKIPELSAVAGQPWGRKQKVHK